MAGFTLNQQRAIDARGNVLVVAGAGTGKTRTLVERCVAWLLQPGAGNSVDHLLVVTFTEAAATEMRQRLRDELKHKLAQEYRAAHLAEQIALLDSAYIGTLHSFCFRLVRQHFHELDLDPELAILPPEEAQLLAEETPSLLFDQHYAGKTEQAKAVQRLIQFQARGWDLPVKRLVLRIHHYAQSLPDPLGWFSDQRALFSATAPTQWKSWLRTGLQEWLIAWRPVLAAASNPNLAECRTVLDSLGPDADLEQFHIALSQIIAMFQRPGKAAGKLRKEQPDFLADAEFLHGLMERAPLSAEISAQAGELGWAAPGCDSDDPLVQDWHWIREPMLTVLELAEEFGREFASAKQEAGVVDFHDLEQMSLRLLWDESRQCPSPLAETWRRKLQLVFVDEYQDINAAQDAILRALGRDQEQANRFLVGDPKQSIYRFRLADPHIFQNYTEKWMRDPSQGQVIALTHNFRSRKAILELVNALFAAVMKKEMGGVAYDELARLQFGLSDSETSASSAKEGPGLRAVELHLRLSGSEALPGSFTDEAADGTEGTWANLSAAEREARTVGLRLAKLKSERFLFWDARAECHRPVEWRDMVILLRSPRGKVEAYAKEFARLGIPLLATRSGFFESLEVADVLNLLSLLDNPLQDVPLLAVLRSPFAGLSLDQLALVRLAAPGRFWVALQQFHRLLDSRPKSHPQAASGDRPSLLLDPQHPLSKTLEDPFLREKATLAWERVDSFLRQYREWRVLARQSSLSACLERVLTESQYFTLLLAQSRGQQLQGNLRKLMTWVRQFDQFQRQSLFRFLQFVDAQKKADIDREPALLETENAVRLMSIHQSKGLEFGIVVVADLGKAFNFADLRADVILDERYGLCPLVKAPFSQQRYPSLPNWLAQKRQRLETLGEELRLLYVGMTRACQSLILVGTASQAAAKRWSERASQAPGLRELAAAKSALDWIGPWISASTGRPDWFSQAEGATELLGWTVYHENEQPLPEESNSPEVSALAPHEASAEDASQLPAVLARVTWRYPNETATVQRAKTSVSALRKEILAQTEEEPRPAPRRARGAGLSAPRLSAAEVGVAHHTFLQFASLDELAGTVDLSSAADRLVSERVLSKEERAALDLESIASFWRSPIGVDVLKHRDSLRRELPFTARLALKELHEFESPDALAKLDPSAFLDEEFIILTGVVDLAVILPEALWILDFKTDSVGPADAEEMAREYQPQLRLYARALGRIYGRPVEHCWLHSLALRRTFDFNLPL